MTTPPAPPAAVVNPTQPKDQKACLKTSPPGPVSRALRAREDAYLAPGAQGYALQAGIAVDRARGSALTDVDGNTYLDFIGGIGVNALGHAHPRFLDALAAQTARVSVGSFTSDARVDLLERLATHAPTPALQSVQLYSGGAEAVESALRLAKSHTGKYEFVGFWGGFHGKTMGPLSLMGSAFKEKLGPLVAGSHLVPYADCYRCPFDRTYPSCDLECARFAKKQVRAISAGSIAGVIVEPMQGTAGNVIPPREFLPILREIADEHGALLIADEMITGFGRTGRYWGIEHSGVTPDIMTVGKAFGGGFPLSGIITKGTIARATPWSNPSGSSSSYGGNPFGAAAGAAALHIIDDERLVQNARDVGAFMLRELVPFVDRYPFVGFVDGLGLLLRIELVKSKATKEPLSTKVTQRIFQMCLQRGLLIMAYSPSVRLQPALTIDQATAENGIAILRDVFDAVLAERLWE